LVDRRFLVHGEPVEVAGGHGEHELAFDPQRGGHLLARDRRDLPAGHPADELADKEAAVIVW